MINKDESLAYRHTVGYMGLSDIFVKMLNHRGQQKMKMKWRISRDIFKKKKRTKKERNTQVL